MVFTSAVNPFLCAARRCTALSATRQSHDDLFDWTAVNERQVACQLARWLAGGRREVYAYDSNHKMQHVSANLFAVVLVRSPGRLHLFPMSFS